MWDGIIVGGGLSGMIAGIRAAERGKQVLLISEGAGSLPYTSATLNIGDFRVLAGNPLHPYAITGWENLHRAYRYFLDTFPQFEGSWEGSAGEPSEAGGKAMGQAVKTKRAITGEITGETSGEISGKTKGETAGADKETAKATREKPLKVLTPLGDLRGAEITLKSLAARPLAEAEKICLIAPAGMKDFFPELFLANLKVHFPQARALVKTIGIPAFESWQRAGRSVPAMDYTRFWHSPAGLVAFRKVLVDIRTAIEQEHSPQATVVIFPGLSIDFSPALKQVLRDFPFPVLETTLFPPSPLGALLYDGLKARLKALGGEIISGGRVTGAESEGGVCRRVKVAGAGKETSFAGKSFILAGGGLLGGGIVASPHRLREPVFALPLFRPSGWTQSDFLEEQPYAYAGVEVDSDLRPLDQTSQVVMDNVLVCGRMLAHWDPWRENCGGGVSLTSGYLAGDKI